MIGKLQEGKEGQMETQGCSSALTHGPTAPLATIFKIYLQRTNLTKGL
jgi:hypothetical protein